MPTNKTTAKKMIELNDDEGRRSIWNINMGHVEYGTTNTYYTHTNRKIPLIRNNITCFKFRIRNKIPCNQQQSMKCETCQPFFFC